MTRSHQTTTASKPPIDHVVWVTNMAAPYRRPVWVALSERVGLTVALLNSDRQFASAQRTGNRGSEWAAGDVVGVDVRVLPTWITRLRGRRWFFLRRSAAPLFRKETQAIVLGGWEQPAYWQLLRFARIRGIRVVGFYESTRNTTRHKSGPVARARRRFFESLDAVVVPGVAAADAVRDMGISSDRIFVGFNAIDTALFSQHENEPDVWGRGHRYLHVGQLVLRKNVDGLIRAFSLVAAPEDTLTVVGKGQERTRLEELAASLGVADRISFLGNVPYVDLPALIHRHQTLVLASTEEVWGLVVNEALAAGLHAVVSTRCGVAPSVAGMRGVWTSEPDPGRLAIAMGLSRDNWAGRIREPEILKYGPQALAQVFFGAIAGNDSPREIV